MSLAANGWINICRVTDRKKMITGMTTKIARLLFVRISEELGTLEQDRRPVPHIAPDHSACMAVTSAMLMRYSYINPYPTAFPYGNGMVLHFYQQQESSTTETVHKVINKGLKTYV